MMFFGIKWPLWGGFGRSGYCYFKYSLYLCTPNGLIVPVNDINLNIIHNI